MDAAKLQFCEGALMGALATRDNFTFDDFQRLFTSPLLCGLANELGNGKLFPIHIRAQAAAMDEMYAEMGDVGELEKYIDKDALQRANDLVTPRKFREITPADVEEAKRIMDKAIKDAREKKARCEKADQEEAERQARKAENRNAKGPAPVPTVVALPEFGKAYKKKDEDDEFAAYAGTGGGKSSKSKRK